SGCERRHEWIGAARQGRRNRPDGCRPRRGILLQTSSNHFLERRIYVGLDGRTRQNFSTVLREPPLLKGGRLKHALANEELVNDQAERKNIRLRREGSADNLLRSHVRGRTRNLSCRAALRGHRKSEIDDASMPATVDHDVGRLQIAVQDSLVVCGRQS